METTNWIYKESFPIRYHEIAYLETGEKQDRTEVIEKDPPENRF